MGWPLSGSRRSSATSSCQPSRPSAAVGSRLAFGLILRSHGWRILFLGADTPLSTLEEAARTTGPDAILLVTFEAGLVAAEGAALRRLARTAPLRLSGPGASPDLTGQLRVRRLDGDLIAAAREVANMTNP